MSANDVALSGMCNMTSCVPSCYKLIKVGKKGPGEGKTVYSCCNVCDDRNELVLRMSHNIKGNETKFKLKCCSRIN